MECLESGVFRNDIPIQWKLIPSAFDELIANIGGGPLACTAWHYDWPLSALPLKRQPASHYHPLPPPTPLPPPLPLPLPRSHPADKALTFAIEVENGEQRADIANYDEVRAAGADVMAEWQPMPACRFQCNLASLAPVSPSGHVTNRAPMCVASPSPSRRRSGPLSSNVSSSCATSQSARRHPSSTISTSRRCTLTSS